MHNKKKSASFCIAVFLCLCGTGCTVASAQQTKRAFTVADEISLTLFGSLYGEPPEVHFSPDGKYFAVSTERGRLDLNRVEDSLRFYDSQDVADFLKHSGVAQPPSPVWVVNRSGKEGQIWSNWRWLTDSSGVAFLEGAGYLGDKRLVLADLRKNTVEFLTSETEAVKAFDINDRGHFVYAAADADDRKKLEDEPEAAETVGTGRPLYELIFSDDPVYRTYSDRRRRKLWAVVDGKRFEVKAKGAPLVVPDGRPLALSPDGQSLVTDLEVPEAPESWGTLYPPSFASSRYRIRPGQPAHQYVRVSLQTGSIQTLTGAPISNDAGWSASGNPGWSADGKAILLPGTFLYSKNQEPSRPCVAVVDLPSEISTCVELLKRRTETGVEDGYHFVSDVRFIGGDKQRVMVVFNDYPYFTIAGTTEYRRAPDGTWQIFRRSKGNPATSDLGFEVTVKQSLNEPPLLVAADKQASRIIWDPNPQLKNLDLGQATVYAWKTKEGRELKAGLFKPTNYKPGQRYPLVIQTHGFVETEFRPSGVFPTAFAAEAVAAAGIAVLQVQEYDCPLQAPGCNCPEGPCEVSEYEAVVSQLVSDGLADPEKIGIVFPRKKKSRTPGGREFCIEALFNH